MDQINYPRAGQNADDKTRVAVLLALSLSHGINDLVQSMVAAIYPLLRTSFSLDFGQIGLITLAFQLTASLLQPFVGLYTDRRAMPYALPAGMAFTLAGLLLLSVAPNFASLVIAASLIGVGSSVFHPEASRLARLASGGQHGLAQSVFQVGGNAGAAMGPLAAALIVSPFGQKSLGWLALLPMCGIMILILIGRWHTGRIAAAKINRRPARMALALPRAKVTASIVVLLALIFSKYFYLATMSNYYTFYLIDKFHLPVPTAQIFLFLFFASATLGTIAGGPIGDRIGRRNVILGSILGVLPVTLALPYANLFFTGVLSVAAGAILSSAFPAIIVYAQELLPGKVGAIAGLFYGFAFGMGGLGAAVLGRLSDLTSVGFVFQLSAFLPAIGLLAFFLPKIDPGRLAMLE
ncbi:MFS transporter, FSR family, fosmidomycin resistance protein [Methylocapsa palsarum]|uniref:MFS transporter, FSR family, fosmidomycin resistance protein n=2 Tax=Methylocapsa palsarum TaxID=1612308 RepID=A0A1I4BKY2_9HYPH|nr:MFS transporter [Methylocapsa palsarum]SFK69010.1 MFS transporter, FSR family, fosmidomycin resistance protein [Methylocapsa palsarum]